MKDLSEALGGVALVVAVVVLGVGLTWVNRDAVWESRAVDAGHARYYLDEDNVRQWEWLEPCREGGE